MLAQPVRSNPAIPTARESYSEQKTVRGIACALWRSWRSLGNPCKVNQIADVNPAGARLTCPHRYLFGRAVPSQNGRHIPTIRLMSSTLLCLQKKQSHVSAAAVSICIGTASSETAGDDVDNRLDESGTSYMRDLGRTDI